VVLVPPGEEEGDPEGASASELCVSLLGVAEGLDELLDGDGLLVGERVALCGRTNLNYTGSSTRVHSRGLQRASNGIIPWPVG
jgi:hypothetical protein